MANVLMIYFQPIFDNDVSIPVCYYESLAQELKNEGNNVLLFNTYNALYLTGKKKNKWLEQILKEIKDFNTDVIFSFNNQIFESIIENTECPIVAFEADAVTYFSNQNLLKKYNYRYFLLTFSEFYNANYIKFGFKKERIIQINEATSIQNIKVPKDKNVSFIGTNFYTFKTCTKDKLMQCNNKDLYEAYLRFLNTNNYNYSEIIDKKIQTNNFNDYDYFYFFDARILVLLSVLDLGLSLYGIGWKNLPDEIFLLELAYNKDNKYSLAHNQEIYNSSKINLSISHPQCCGNSFPWRVYDILASDGVLVSSYSKKLEDISKKYDLDIQMFESPFEARDLCKKLLKDKQHREEIVAKSNQYIEKYGRWQNNFKIIQDNIRINLLNKDKTIGNIESIKYKAVDPNSTMFNQSLLLMYKYLRKKLIKKRII